MTQNKNDKALGVSRRKFLQGTGVGAAALGSAGLLSGAALAGTQSQSLDACKTPGCDYDVVVIGGGFSGITAARDLRKDGYKVLVLEARNRLGGRTFSSQFEGHNIELGGTWIHFTQPFIWAEKERYGLEVKETPGAVPEMMVAYLDGKGKALTEAQVYEFIQVFQAYNAEARNVLERPWDILHAKDQALRADQMSGRDRLNQLKLSPLMDTLMDGLICSLANNSADNVSYLDTLRWFQLPGGDFLTTLDSATRYKLKKGTGYLLNKMVEDGNPDVRLSTPVKKVEDLGGQVRITTVRGETIIAASVIVALPMNVLPNVEFSPALPPQLKLAADERHSGAGFKVYIKVKGKLGKVFGIAGSDHPMGALLTYEEAEDHTLLVGFGNDPAKLDVYDDEAVQAMVRNYFPDAEVEGVFSYDWQLDPYSQGTYCSYKPGWIEKYHDHFQQDRGRTFFGQGDHDSGWRGFIDGAIGAGSKAAQRVNETLKKSLPEA